MADVPDVQGAKDGFSDVLQSAQKRVEDLGESPFPTVGKGAATAAMAQDAVKGGPAAFGSPQLDPKALKFETDGLQTPATPVMNTTTTTTTSEDVDYNQFILETLLWTNKFRSAFYFVVGLLLWVVMRSIFLSNTTIVTGTCYVLLGSLAFNFMRGVMMPEWQKRCTWTNSAWSRFAIATGTANIQAASELHDKHLNGLDPLRTLEVALLLWVVSILGRALDAVTLVLLLHVVAFSVPVAYKTYKAKVDKVVGDAYAQAKAKYEGVDRKVRAGGVLAALAALFFVLPVVDRFAAFFTCIAYARSILKPSEYDAFQKRIEPVTNTVKKLGNKASTMAVSTMNKYELTPTPNKKRD